MSASRSPCAAPRWAAPRCRARHSAGPPQQPMSEESRKPSAESAAVELSRSTNDASARRKWRRAASRPRPQGD
eukprot:255710-Pleurochrysis_carterae.AAC.1